MTTSSADKKYLRALGHQLKPVVTVAGNGLTENVITEVDRALNDHELIKIKLVHWIPLVPHYYKKESTNNT